MVIVHRAFIISKLDHPSVIDTCLYTPPSFIRINISGYCLFLALNDFPLDRDRKKAF